MSTVSDEDLAQKLCRAVEADLLRRHPLTGDDRPCIEGPGGEWRLRMEPKRGTMHICITAPTKERMWSFKGMVRHLQSILPDADLSLYDTDEVLDQVGTEGIPMLEDPPSIQTSIDTLAAILIQRTVRMHCVVRNQQRIAKLQESNRMHRAAQTTLCDEETRIRFAHGARLALRKMTDGLQTCDDIQSPTSLLTNETNFTRAVVLAQATNIMSAGDMKTLERLCAKGIVMDKHFPLVLGTLPLPTGVRRVTLLGKTLFAKGETRMTPAHYAALRKEFKEKWANHVTRMLEARPVIAYDMYSDETLTQYTGSMVISKFLTRHHRILTPAISIESIVVGTKKRGSGSFLFDMAKQLLFTDTQMNEGVIFAQCLPLEFWNHLLDVSNIGRTLIFQLSLIYSSYEMEEDCIMRAKIFFRYDDASSGDESKMKKKKQRTTPQSLH
jgi:hypothetical protein